MRQLGETPDELVAHLDRLYLVLATMYRRIGRVLNVRPRLRPRRREVIHVRRSPRF